MSQRGLPSALTTRFGRRLKDREQRARALILSWKQEPPLLETPKEMEAPLQFPQAKPEGPEEEVQVPGKKVRAPHARAGFPGGAGRTVPQARAEGCRLARGWLCHHSGV